MFADNRAQVGKVMLDIVSFGAKYFSNPFYFFPYISHTNYTNSFL